MMKPHTLATRTIVPAVLLVAFALAPATSADELAEENPWAILETLRTEMQRSGPLTSLFVQTYVPAGFDSGDEETGSLSMWFPDCLRWSYEPPQEKNFLICQGEVYSWSEEEPGGRHARIDPRQEPGLDLLLVPIDTLRQRYTAASKALDDGSWEIALETPRTETGSFRAKIHLDADGARVRGLEYTDNEGNFTRFAISDYENLSHTALFQPPAGIEWTEE